MADSTTNLDQLAEGQLGAEERINSNFDAASPAMLYGRRAASTGVTWAYYGGKILVDGVVVSVANGTAELAPSTVNYIEADRDGVVSVNQDGFTPGRAPLYTVTHGDPTTYVDHRVPWRMAGLALIEIDDSNYTLTATEARCDIIEVTSSVSLTATRDVIVPLAPQQWTVANLTDGSQSIRIIGASGTGVTIGTGKIAIVYSDGSDVVRVTGDA